MSATTPRSKSEGKYANPTIRIFVGRKRQLFHVHYAFLEKTDFFKVHGDPTFPTGTTPTPTRTPTRASTRAGRSLDSPVRSEHTVTPDRGNIKEELDSENDTYGNDSENNGASPAGASDAVTAPAYRLQGLIYEPEAFEVVVNYLYNEPPDIPTTGSECIILMKAYILALHYRMPGLQDDVVDCFRKYHAEYDVKFAHLFWISGRVGEGDAMCKVPLIQYLVDQIAFEIFQRGYDNFVQNNTDFEVFLTKGDRPLRKELFKAMSKVAEEKDPLDPALGTHRWRVADYPKFERGHDASPTSLEIIDLD
ncbi:hypothetical protein AYO21_01239 [Fonsecaea monophora]|uniref:Uncharacterized protein n=1 Tax=Fonsecaea monophora TaxID=254056 RepID=A0A177FNK4_9EURO|nr:hypothetical protein AYO21_01239 [Fonsecaea monophora]OAG44749.1 hypothetical protein AYO21_01239 [Fonsecaea monophora]